MNNSFFSDYLFYFKTAIFGGIVFAGCYRYLVMAGISSELNKAVADTAIILMGLSMWLSSLCYYFNIFDWAIVYRKYLGLIGFAFALAHLFLSWDALERVLAASTWSQAAPAGAGVLALGIFTVMAVVSNMFMAKHLGGLWWRRILRAGYIAILFTVAHVVLLKSARWWTWYETGMPTWPALSLLVTGLMTVIVLMRIGLWWSVRRTATVVMPPNQKKKR